MCGNNSGKGLNLNCLETEKGLASNFGREMTLLIDFILHYGCSWFCLYSVPAFRSQQNRYTQIPSQKKFLTNNISTEIKI